MEFREVAHEAASKSSEDASAETQRDSLCLKFISLRSLRKVALILIISLISALVIFFTLNMPTTIKSATFVNYPVNSSIGSDIASAESIIPNDHDGTLTMDPLLGNGSGNSDHQSPVTERMKETVQNEIARKDTWELLDLERQKPQLHGDGWKPVYFTTRRDIAPSMKFPSQIGQEHLILNYLLQTDEHRYNGVFLDIASNEPIFISNTYILEKFFNWTGICVEPNPLYWGKYVHTARKCQLVAAAVAEHRNQDFNFIFRGGLGGLVGEDFDNKDGASRDVVNTVPLQTVPLAEILDELKLPRVITYLSLDVEGAENLVLSEGFDFDKYTFWIITAERPKADLQERLERHGYHYLRDCGGFGDRVYIHKTIPNFDQIVEKFSLPPLTKDIRINNCNTLEPIAGIVSNPNDTYSYDDTLAWSRLFLFTGNTSSLIRKKEEESGITLEHRIAGMNGADRLAWKWLSTISNGYVVDVDPIRNSVGEMLELKSLWSGLCISNPDDGNLFENVSSRPVQTWYTASRTCNLVLYDRWIHSLEGLVSKFFDSQRIDLVTFGNEVKPGWKELVSTYKARAVLIRSSRLTEKQLVSALPEYKNLLAHCPLPPSPASNAPQGSGGRPVFLVHSSLRAPKQGAASRDPALCEKKIWDF